MTTGYRARGSFHTLAQALGGASTITHLHPNPCADCAQPDRHRTRGLKVCRATPIPTAPSRATSARSPSGRGAEPGLAPSAGGRTQSAVLPRAPMEKQVRPCAWPRALEALLGGPLARLPPASLARGPRAHFLRAVSKFAPRRAGHRAAAVCHVRRFGGYRQHHNKSDRCGARLRAPRTQVASEAHCTLPHACPPSSSPHQAGWPSYHVLLCAAELRRAVAQMSSRSGCSFSGWSWRRTATWQHQTWCAAALTS